MSTTPKDAHAFADRMLTDKEFSEKLGLEAIAEDPSAIVARAKAEGYEFTEEELKSVMQQKLSGQVNADGSLSEEALAGVSGGNPLFTIGGQIIKSVAKWALGGFVASTGIKTAEKLSE